MRYARHNRGSCSLIVPETGADIWALPLDGSGLARPVVNSRADDTYGALSPDGRWLAYMSNESGQSEVYVQPFPEGSARQLVSAGGGYPWWSTDGRELSYFGLDRRPYVASVSAGARLDIGSPRAIGGPLPPIVACDIHQHGRRRLMCVVSDDQTATGTRADVIVNWFEELKRLVPVD